MWRGWSWGEGGGRGEGEGAQRITCSMCVCECVFMLTPPRAHQSPPSTTKWIMPVHMNQQQSRRSVLLSCFFRPAQQACTRCAMCCMTRKQHKYTLSFGGHSTCQQPCPNENGSKGGKEDGQDSFEPDHQRLVGRQGDICRVVGVPHAGYILHPLPAPGDLRKAPAQKQKQQ